MYLVYVLDVYVYILLPVKKSMLQNILWQAEKNKQVCRAEDQKIA